MTTRVRATDLLIAPPNIPDPRFKNSVLMITHNEPSGSFALCVNRPTQMCLRDVLEDMDLDLPTLPNLPIYWGGPVGRQSLWMLHSSDWVCKGTVMITSAWAMTSSEEMFHCMADGDLPKHLRMVMGYCHWGAGQLAAELDGTPPWNPQHSWLVAQNLGPEWLLEQDPEDIWASATTLSSHQAVDSWL